MVMVLGLRRAAAVVVPDGSRKIRLARTEETMPVLYGERGKGLVQRCCRHNSCQALATGAKGQRRLCKQCCVRVQVRNPRPFDERGGSWHVNVLDLCHTLSLYPPIYTPYSCTVPWKVCVFGAGSGFIWLHLLGSASRLSTTPPTSKRVP